MQYIGMTLDEYLTSKNITDAAFAGIISRDPATVGRLRRGITKPDWETLPRIVEATEGAVTPNDFLPAPAPSSEHGAAA